MFLRRSILIVVVLLALLALTAPASAQQQQTHTVQPGETLGSIARLYGLTIDAIAFANGITNPDLIYVGQVLKIPIQTGGSSSGGSASTSGTATYTVAAGDTLYGIARKFNTTFTTLASLNNITNVDSLAVGQVLKVPSASGSTPAPTASSSTTIPPQPSPTGQSGPAASVTYTVQAGDTLGQIALRFGTSTQQIVLLNGLTNADLIYVGQVLLIQQASSQSATATPTKAATGASTTAAGITPSATTQAGVTLTATQIIPTVPPTATETPLPTPTYPPGFMTPTPQVPRTPIPAQALNLLINPGFEGNTRSVGGDTLNIFDGWQPFFCHPPYTTADCPALRAGTGNPAGLMMGTPQYASVSTGFRVKAGNTAQQWSCFWTACRGGVYQTFATTPEAECEVTAYVQSWSSNDFSIVSDLMTQDARDNSTWFILIDLTGGTNAYASGIQSSRGFGYLDGIYDQYAPISYVFTAAGSQTTVFFENLRLWPLTNNFNYLDETSVRCGL
jgi:LysM repeat protein